jgi:outer membrane protein OmpA-like peptidoglycan-associated protein
VRARKHPATPAEQRAPSSRPATAARLTPAPHLLAAGGRGRGPGVVSLARRIQTTAGNRALRRALTPGSASSVLQRRLIATGEVNTFIAMVEPAIGLSLAHDPITGEVTAVGTRVTPATSPALAAILTTIMSDTAQDAQAHFGRAQNQVSVGAFPVPDDLTGSGEQLIDLDDVENLEAGAPGHGLAKFAHELQENYVAHSQVPVAGVSLFGPAHEEGVRAESDVVGDLVAAGADRVASRSAPGATASERIRVQDFTTHFLVWREVQTGADFPVANARVAARNLVSTHTIDGFATGSNAMPAGGAAVATAARADLLAHPQATAHIVGFTDNVGRAGVNDPLSRRRAATVRAAVAGGGVGPGALHAAGRGATSFVAANDSDANRRRNRRVVITIEEPAP